SERLQFAVLQDVRLYGRTLSGPEAAQLGRGPRALELFGKAQRTPQETNELFDWWTATLDQPTRELNAKLAALQQEAVAIKSRGPIAHVRSDGREEPKAYVLFRGDYDKRRDEVKADTPKALPAMSKDLPRNRLGFAQWLLREDHPLTTRVTVNRFWQEIFGT